jgi:hypothetical protein
VDAVSLPPGGLKEAVEGLYRVFRNYELKTPLHERYGEPVKEPVTSELRAMTAEELALPIGHAMTTWGEVEDFKHVLPRIAELIARREMGSYDPTIGLGCHLTYGKWREWPRREQEAVERFLLLLWEDVLVHHEDPHKFTFSGQDEPLHIMVAAEIDIQPALLRWQELLGTNAGHCLWQMVASIDYRAIEKFYTKGQGGLVSAFEKSPEPTRAVVNWLMSDGLMLAVERAVVETSDEELAVNLSYACTKIEEIRSIVSSFWNRSA